MLFNVMNLIPQTTLNGLNLDYILHYSALYYYIIFTNLCWFKEDILLFLKLSHQHTHNIQYQLSTCFPI